MADTWFGGADGIVGQHITTWSGSIPTTAGTITFVKNGRQAILIFPFVQALSTSTTFINMDTNLPSIIYPLFTIQVMLQITANSQQAVGNMQINAGDGSLSIAASLNGNTFATAQTNGFVPQVVSYITE